MTYNIDQFCGECREILCANSGSEGQDLVRQRLERLLANKSFIDAECGPGVEPGIRTVYRDKETKFNVLVHVYSRGKKGPPHDHGQSWAVYGQATEWTDMTLWERRDDGKKDGFADLQEKETYRLDAGMAGRFGVGKIHSISFPDGASFIRVTGTDLDTIPTNRFNPDTQSVIVGGRL